MPDVRTLLRRWAVATGAALFLLVVLTGIEQSGKTAHAQDGTPVDINPDQSTLDSGAFPDADGASGGRVNGIDSDAGGTTFFAASEWGGLFQSSDAGQTWTHLPGHVPSATWDVAVDPSDPNRVYATSFYDGRVDSLAGINVSTDGGVTWTHPETAEPPSGFCRRAGDETALSAFGISIDADFPESVYIGTNCGLAISDDSGASWSFVDPTPGSRAGRVWDVIVHDGGIIDLCGDDGHQRSDTGGASWSTASSLGLALPQGRCSLTVSPDEPDVLIAVSGTTIYESDDGGVTWPTILTNPLAQGRIPFVAANQRTGDDFDLWFGDVQLHRTSCTTPASPGSASGARCPTNMWTGPYTRDAGGHDDAGDILFDPTAATDACPLLFSSDGGIYLNTVLTDPDCHSPEWEQPTITPHALWLFAMSGTDAAGHDEEDLYFGAQDNGTYSTADAGSASPNWVNRNCCDSFDFVSDAANVLYTLCCYPSGRANRLYLRGPGLSGGSEINTYPPGNLPGFRSLDIIDQFGPNQYVVATTSGVYITNDITASPIFWVQLGTSPAGICNVKAAISAGTPTFYIQTGICSEQSPLYERDVWRFVGTDPAADVWQQIDTPDGTGGFGVYDVDPGNPERIIAAHLRPNLDPAMVLSPDGGATWTALTALDTRMTGGGTFNYTAYNGPTNMTSFNGYPQPTLVAFDPQNPDLLVAAGADTGIFVSLDGGTGWILATDPIDPAASGTAHIPRPQFAYFDHEPVSLADVSVNIFIGSKGRGVWRITEQLMSPFNGCLVDVDSCLPELDTGLIVLDCSGLDPAQPCVFLDHLTQNCLVKWECPACGGPTQLCPPFYHIYLDGLDPQDWSVQLFSGAGEPAEFEISRTDNGVVLSFLPEDDLFAEGEIGDYQLAFQLRPYAERGRYEIQTHLEVSDAPFTP